MFSRLYAMQMTAKCVLEMGDTVADKSDSILVFCQSLTALGAPPLVTHVYVRTP